MREITCNHSDTEFLYETKEYRVSLCPACTMVMMAFVMRLYNSFSKEEKAKFHEIDKAVIHA